MEQQQCPICMLYLLPGMNLQDHLDTHPKDMIIKALLSAKTPAIELPRASPPHQQPQLPQQQSSNEMATVFLTATPFNPSQAHIYHQPQQQTQALLAKRNASPNNAVLIGNTRPYRWAAIDAQQPSATFLNAQSTPTSSSLSSTSGNYVSGNVRRSAGDSAETFRCIQQNTEQKNIMIVNTSSTQLSIQQTVPLKKPTAATFEIHPVIIDSGGGNNGGNGPSAISIIPRYTSEKYSGPPPSYESSITNTINDKQQPRVIDLTQTPTAASSSSSLSASTTTVMKLQNNNNNNNNNSNNKLTTLASCSNNNQAPTQKILEYTQTENGDFMITEKVIATQTSHGDDATEISIEEISATDDDNGYNVKFVEIDEPMEFKFATQEHQNEGEEMEEEFGQVEDHAAYSGPSKKSSTGVKVISNVKLTSAELSPTIKNIIQQYNNSKSSSVEDEQEKSNSLLVNVSETIASDSEMEEEEEINKKEVKVETTSLIQCTETLNLSKDKEESSEAVAGTSVIRKTFSNDTVSDEKTESLQPSTSSSCNNNSNNIKPLNVVFNTNLTSNNRLKPKEIYKQPKKLVVKLKTPLVTVESGECSSSAITAKDEHEEKLPIKQEIIENEENINENEPCTEKPPKVEQESAEQFTVTFLDGYEPISKITITPEIHHDSETNQSIMSMDLEPETSGDAAIKREQVESELPIIVKTEMNSCSELSMPSHSQNSSCSRDGSPVPSTSSRNNVDSACINAPSPINFLYQNDRVRFSPPLSPYVYMKTFSGDDQPKQEHDASWNNNSNSLVTQNSDQNSSCSRYTPSFDDNRSNYTDLDVNIKTSRSDVHIRAPSTDSLNIRTDEKMPARGEISEQESNGEIEQPWHHPYFQLQAYPSSYDMNTAQECWNLSKADSQNACDTNNIQNVIINFSPLNGQEDIKAPDLLKTIMQTVTKHEPVNDEASGSSSNLIAKKIRTFRCHECSKVFTKLKARNRHTDQEHPHLRRIKKNKVAPTATQTSKSESSIFAPVAGSSSSLVSWTAASSQQPEQEVKVLSIIKNEPSTSAAVLVKNEMNRMLISTTGSIKMEMDRLLLEPSTSSTSQQQISTLGLKIKRTYMCAKCNEQFRTLKLLDKHFQIHPAECTLCQKTFNSWNTFSLHLKNHLNIRVHACRFCPKRFVQRQRLVEHERIHTGHMPIKCPDCDERFRRYSNMLHHRARVHLNKKAKQEDYVCDCGEIFQTKAKLEWHQETHENKPKPCPYCRERFTHRNSLTRHIRLSHTEKYVFVKSKAVNCPICNCTYLPSSIKAHMATHQISNKEYSCSICSKQFSTKWNLKQHHWTHANRSSKPFQCNICPSAFVRETDYTTHMNAHRSIKPFTCNTCGKRFVRKYNWLRHSREHEREKKFNCEICQKRFHRAYYLTEHKRVHTGERPFSCTICGKTSATKTNHNKHIKIHHARDPLTAEN